jgi:hypothetical protein
VRQRRGEFDEAIGRYSRNGGLPDDVKLALRDLELFS